MKQACFLFVMCAFTHESDVQEGLRLLDLNAQVHMYICVGVQVSGCTYTRAFSACLTVVLMGWDM